MVSQNSSVTITNLTKKFGTTAVIQNVSFSIPHSTVYALIGPNGAGKTTLLKMLVGLLYPTSGTAEIENHNIVTETIRTKEQFAYISDDPSGYDYLSGREFLALTGKLRNITPTEIEKRIKELVPLFSMEKHIDARMGEYSRGNREKVVFLAALLGNPRVLIIDEPIVGLDPESITIFGESLRKFAETGGTVLFTTHILSFAKQYADMIGVLVNGKIVYEGETAKNNDIERIYKDFVKES